MRYKLNINFKEHMDLFLQKAGKYEKQLIYIPLLVCLLFSTIAVIRGGGTINFNKVGVNSVSYSFIKHLTQQDLTEANRTSQMLRFSKILEQEVKRIGKEGKVVFVDEAVIVGGNDLTPILAKRVKERLYVQKK